MSLQTRILLIILTIVSLYAVLDYTGQRFFVLPSFVSLEQSSAQNSARHCVAVLKRQIANLGKTTKDWAASDNIYQLVKDRNSDYSSTKLGINLFLEKNLNLIYICDTKGEVVWGKIHDLKNDTTIALDEFPACSWPLTHPLLGHDNPKSSIKGIFMTERGPMLVASDPITTGRKESSICGSLITGRFLDESALRAFNEKLLVDLKLWDIADDSFPPEEKDVLNHINAESQFFVRELNDKALHVYTLFPDIQGTPAILMRVYIPRNIRTKGIAALIRSNLLSNLTAGLFAAIALWAVLRVIVVGPITKLTKHITTIANGENISTRLTMTRSDEIGTLAREFNNMLEQLAESRRKLSEQSYNLGKAEVASGVLHNVRNVLTPLLTRVDGLRQKLQETTIDKVKMAVSELNETNLSNERREDLTTFINLSNKSLVNIIQAAKENVDDMAKLVAQIEEMLDQQGRHSRAALPKEEIRLADLLRDSIALLPTDLCNTISVEIDPSVEAFEPIAAHSVTLLQIFNNILINAAESIQRDSSTQGKIHIRAKNDEVNGEGMVHVEISDNGEGIEPCNLSRIFERGVSTKQIVPSGIGLHWCANTIAAMNGSIYANSKGRGQGASFHILLPAYQQTSTLIDVTSEVKS